MKYFLKLPSVGAAIDTSNLMTYPLLKSGRIDFDNEGTHLDECSNEWFSSLSIYDYGTVNNLINNRNN